HAAHPNWSVAQSAVADSEKGGAVRGNDAGGFVQAIIGQEPGLKTEEAAIQIRGDPLGRLRLVPDCDFVDCALEEPTARIVRILGETQRLGRGAYSWHASPCSGIFLNAVYEQAPAGIIYCERHMMPQAVGDRTTIQAPVTVPHVVGAVAKV